MELNQKNMRKLALLIAFAVLLALGVSHLGGVLRAASALLQLIAPFLLGACIAFILNVPMTWIERSLFSKLGKHRILQKSSRLLSLLLTLVLIIGIIAIAVGIVSPQIAHSISVLTAQLPAFVEAVRAQVEQLQVQQPMLAQQLAQLNLNWEKIDWKNLISTVSQFLQSGAAGDMLGSTMTVASSIIGGIVKFFLGLFFAAYILMQKEKLGQQAEKILFAFLPTGVVESIRSVAGLSKRTFESFISGQCIEACILGTMFFISMTILRFPYALLIGVVIALTALIPIFGSFIGLMVGVFLIMVENPVQALWFVVLFLVMQQIEGNFVYPHVVGGSVGLPSIWVLVAVTLGASTFGVLGMLIAIPLFSVLYALLRTTVYSRLRMRGISLSRWHGEAEEPPAPDVSSK